MDLFQRRGYEELLTRVEGHAATRRLHANRSKRAGKGNDLQLKAKRARSQAAEGAYRKAVAGFTTEMAHFSAVEDRSWAEKLLPKTSLAGGSLAAPVVVTAAESASLQPDFAVPPTARDGSDEWPLKGGPL